MQSSAATPLPTATRRPWLVLVVDDDPDVHRVSKLVLPRCSFEGRGVEMLSAHSGAEARQLLQAHPDIALMLLDVVMETEYAGLELVPYVRETLKNPALRIVLRTGQPGQSPPLEMMVRWEIDDYRSKTELTAERLMMVTISALRTYRQMRDLVDANRELEHFAHAASHDLQTPLRNIVSLSQVLVRRLPESQASEREIADHIVRSGYDLHHLIDSLLRYARLGRQALPEVPVDLNAAVKRALARLDGLIRERQVTVSVGPLPTVPGIATEIEQLFCNLIENGVKYQPGAAPKIEITARDLEGRWEIRIRDHGIGIEPEHIERIFEPFVRLHVKDEIPGSGIGLSICRKVVERFGGTLRAESGVGAGTTMVIGLPAPSVPAAPSPPLRLR